MIAILAFYSMISLIEILGKLYKKKIVAHSALFVVTSLREKRNGFDANKSEDKMFITGRQRNVR